MAFSGVISMGTYIAARENGMDKYESIFIAWTTTMLVGTIKELNDKKYSPSDVRHNAIGTSIGISIPLLVEEF